MIVASNDLDGEIVLERKVGRNQVNVSSSIQGIESGIYDVEYRKGAKNPPLNEVWLKLIGIEKETMIVTNSRFETKRLTWRNLLRVFYLDEGRVDDIDSIIEPKHRYMENALFLSAPPISYNRQDFYGDRCSGKGRNKERTGGIDEPERCLGIQNQNELRPRESSQEETIKCL